jgi:hypothetical protein
MHKLIRKRVLIPLTVVAVAAFASVAFGFFSSSGSGTGSASTGTDTGFTVTLTNTPSGLYPGGPAQPVEFTVTNKGPSEQSYSLGTTKIISVEDSKGTDVSASCVPGTDLIVTDPTIAQTEVASGETKTYGSENGATVKLAETGHNQDACKNVTVGLEISVK